MLAEDERADAGDVGRGEAVAGGADRAALRPREVEIEAAPEELDRRRGVVVEESARRPPRDCRRRSRSRSATGSSPRACRGPRRRGGDARSRRGRRARAAAPRTWCASSRGSCSRPGTPARSPTPARAAGSRRRPCSRHRGRGRSSARRPVRARARLPRRPFRARRGRLRRPRRPAARLPRPRMTATGVVDAPDEGMVELDAAVEDAGPDAGAGRAAPGPLSVTCSGSRHRYADPVDRLRRQAPGREVLLFGVLVQLDRGGHRSIIARSAPEFRGERSASGSGRPPRSRAGSRPSTAEPCPEPVWIAT